MAQEEVRQDFQPLRHHLDDRRHGVGLALLLQILSDVSGKKLERSTLIGRDSEHVEDNNCLLS